jgi:hypothetical protein
MKYTYSDEEDDGYSDTTSRRSTRNTGTHTPAEPAGPTVTLSGRQVRSRQGGTYGESMLSGTHTPAVAVGGNDGASDDHNDDGDVVGRRPRRTAAVQGQIGYKSGGLHIEGYNSVDEMDDEDDASEQDYGDDEEDDHVSIESDVEESEDLSHDDEEMEDDLMDDAGRKRSLVVKLPVKTPTPEKKATITRTLTPDEKGAEPIKRMTLDNSVPKIEGKVGISAREERVPQAAPARSTHVIPKESSSTESSKPINMPAQSDINRMHPSPLSPSLAYRGSPEKPHTFPAPINVSHSGT